MPSYFNLSICFLDPRFHGRGSSGEPEWPPSPLRVFQALVASAGRGLVGEFSSGPRSALEWLESQPAPTILAPFGLSATSGFRLSVPNNSMDIVAKAWCRGNDSNLGDANPATHRTMKVVRPTHLIDGDSVHYLWLLPDSLNDAIRGHVEALAEIARNLTVLGWGIDMVVGQGEILSGVQENALSGERWLPKTKADYDGLRVPVKGTLHDLTVRYSGFLKRLEHDKFTPPPPLFIYDKIRYRRDIDSPQRQVAAFSLLKPDARGFRSFDTARWALTVAGMTRHAANSAAKRAGWSDARVNSFILGHGESIGEQEHITVGPKRFAYIPLPSIEARGGTKAHVVGNVRRVMLTIFDEECEDEIIWAQRTLSGQVLEKTMDGVKQPMALLSLLSSSDNVIHNYVRSSASWATVTPVVLPGYDDPAHYRRRLKGVTDSAEQKRLLAHLDERIECLIRKSLLQAGFSQILADNAEIEWRKVGYWRGTDLAESYGVPDHLRRFPRYHVKINWRDGYLRPLPIHGPICIGGGRFYGLGLFAAK